MISIHLATRLLIPPHPAPSREQKFCLSTSRQKKKEKKKCQPRLKVFVFEIHYRNKYDVIRPMLSPSLRVCFVFVCFHFGVNSSFMITFKSRKTNQQVAHENRQLVSLHRNLIMVNALRDNYSDTEHSFLLSDSQTSYRLHSRAGRTTPTCWETKYSAGNRKTIKRKTRAVFVSKLTSCFWWRIKTANPFFIRLQRSRQFVQQIWIELLHSSNSASNTNEQVGNWASRKVKKCQVMRKTNKSSGR